MKESLHYYLTSLLQRGKHLAHVTKKEVEKEIKILLSSGVLTHKEAKALKKSVLEEIVHEKKHLKKVIECEMQHIKKRSIPLVKKAVKTGEVLTKKTLKKTAKNIVTSIKKQGTNTRKKKKGKRRK